MEEHDGQGLYTEPAIKLTPLPDGGSLLESRLALAPFERSVAQMLRRWAERAPDRLLIAERDRSSAWRRVTYGEARAAADSIGQALLDRGLGPERPVMVLSGNSLDHALLMLGCFTAGVPIVPVSPAYSLQSADFAKLRHAASTVRPGLIYVADAALFGPALSALEPRIEIAASVRGNEVGGTQFSELLSTTEGAEVERAFNAVRPDTVAKVLFTSGSTGGPKGVINTHRMLCANQQALAQVWPFCEVTPPVLVDWLPWSHTFGGNHNFNLVLRHGGSLYLDAGKPLPGLFDTTRQNLREVSPTIYFNVPAGFAQLIPALEADEGLARSFFARLRMIFYAGAALPPDLWERLRALSTAVVGGEVAMTTSWGATETAPAVTSAHFPVDRPGNIGVPLPGVQLKLAPVGAKLELRVKGPNVTPGYLRRPHATARAFDEDGFYRTGDAGRLVDPSDGNRGVMFCGRIGEDFKLTTGTWVSAGSVRSAVLAACDGLLQDAVVTGHDRAQLGLLAWINPAAAQRVVPPSVDVADPVAVAGCKEVVEAVQRALVAYNAASRGSASRIARLLLMTEPPSLDAGEITDKGYINQRAVLDRRSDAVDVLYSEPVAGRVIELLGKDPSSREGEHDDASQIRPDRRAGPDALRSRATHRSRK
jgi:feruloyl-CoA synthase